MTRRTYVFVHGASHGGWCWEKILPFLQQDEVYTPTLTGMGDRSHLLAPSITLNTHIDDIKNFINYRRLSNVILVGHSYAGLVISGVIEAIPELIKHAIYLDAFLPENNKTGFDVIGEPYVTDWQILAQTNGDGWLMRADEATIDNWGVTEAAHRDFLRDRITDFSLNYLRTKLFIGTNYLNMAKSYIRCTGRSYCFDLMIPHFERAKQQGYQIYTMDSPHDPVISHPQELVDCLRSVSV